MQSHRTQEAWEYRQQPLYVIVPIKIDYKHSRERWRPLLGEWIIVGRWYLNGRTLLESISYPFYSRFLSSSPHQQTQNITRNNTTIASTLGTCMGGTCTLHVDMPGISFGTSSICCSYDVITCEEHACTPVHDKWCKINSGDCIATKSDFGSSYAWKIHPSPQLPRSFRSLRKKEVHDSFASN